MHVGAVHAAVRSNKQRQQRHQLRYEIRMSPSRLEVAKRARAADKRRAKIMREYDTNKTGTLDHDELKKLMESLAQGLTIGDDEVDYYMRRFGKSGDGGISRKELDGLLLVCCSYLETKPITDKLMEKYDVTKNGALDKEELRKLMADLNGGEVTDEDVAEVLAHADPAKIGEIEKPELQRALAMWFTQIEHNKSCCVVL